MEWFLANLETTTLAQYLRNSRWGYAAVNAAHILGIALLVGAILPLNMRLLGFWSRVPLAALTRVLVPAAATGLGLAICAGALLFAARAREYAVLGVLQFKLALVAVGIAAAIALHHAYGLNLDAASRARLASHAALSTLCWIGALICGRLIAFIVD